MSLHSFDPDVAKAVGVNAATIYQSILFWTRKNLANERHVRDGKVWTYNSVKAMEDLFPYLTAHQIRTAMQKLLDSGLIFEGNFNETTYDRTKWYGVPVEVHCEKAQIHLGKNANGFAEKRKPIPVSKPVSKPDLPQPQRGVDLFSAEEEPKKQDRTSEVFDRFWKEYPKKAGKPAALKAFTRAIKKTDPEIIISGARRYAAWLKSAKPGEFRPTAKHPQGWLNDERWNDEEIKPAAKPMSYAQQVLAEYGGRA